MRNKIGIEINGVLRDTLDKVQKTYQKYMIDKVDGIEDDDNTIREIILPITSLKLTDHFVFTNEEEYFSFLYEEFPMEIFGHAQSTEYTTFNDFNQFYLNQRENFDIVIVSDEIGKSKPASLFFLSKFGCLVEKIKFYSNITLNSMWDEVDILLTANPELLLKYPENKIVIKFEREYNQTIECKYTIKSIKELEKTIQEIWRQTCLK